MALDPLSIEREIIGLETAPPPLDAVSGLQAGMAAGKAVENKLADVKDIAAATEFEKLLESGEQGMMLALEDAEAQGVDLTGVPDPKLYLKSKEDSANWYSFLSGKLEKHQNQVASKEAFTSISTGTPEEAQAGIGKLVEIGQVPALEGANAAKKIDFDIQLQEHITGKTKLVAEGEGSGSEDEVEINIDSFIPSTGTNKAPPEIKAAGDAAAKKLNLPADLLLSLAKRESSFDPLARPINRKTGKRVSSAFGLGQLIDKTAKDIFTKTQAQGLIGKDVDLETARADATMNLIMTGVLFKENLKTMGNVRDALLAHRLGPTGARKFIETGKAMVNGVDEGDDVRDWIGDVMTGAFGADSGGDGITGTFSDGSKNLDTVAGIDAEIQRLLSKAEFSATEPARLAVSELQKKRTLLMKGKGKKSKDSKKGVDEAISLVISLAENVEPKGRVSGFFRNTFAALGFDDDAKTLSDFVGGLAGQVAKGIGGESGRLTDQDRLYAIRMMPSALDTKGERESKVRILRSMLEASSSLDKRDLLYKGISEINRLSDKNKKIEFTSDQLAEEYKAKPSDNLIASFLMANGKEASDDNIRMIKSRLEEASRPSVPSAPASATVIQSGSDAAAQAPAPLDDVSIQTKSGATMGGGIAPKGEFDQTLNIGL